MMFARQKRELHQNNYHVHYAHRYRGWARLALLFLLGAGIFEQVPGHAAEIRIAAWNVANFSAEPGVAVFGERGTKRTRGAIEVLKKTVSLLDADILLLQEMTDLRALSQLVPRSTYWFFLSPRYHEPQRRLDPDLFSAVAVRHSARFDLIDAITVRTGVSYAEGGSTYFARDIDGVVIDVSGLRVGVFSVHLKAGCADVNDLAGSRMAECDVLRQQGKIIGEWLEQKIETFDAVVLGGDFNRHFTKFGESDHLLTLMRSGVRTDRYSFDLLPLKYERHCPTHVGVNKAPLDYFLLFKKAGVDLRVRGGEEQTFFKGDVRVGAPLSDHCPILMTITF